jgi:hypothetical protein
MCIYFFQTLFLYQIRVFFKLLFKFFLCVLIQKNTIYILESLFIDEHTQKKDEIKLLGIA